MVASAEPGAPGFLDLVIRNEGRGPALNVRVEFEPDLAESGMEPFPLQNFQISPGQGIKFCLGEFSRLEAMPITELKVKVSYQDIKKKTHEEEFLVTLTGWGRVRVN